MSWRGPTTIRFRLITGTTRLARICRMLRGGERICTSSRGSADVPDVRWHDEKDLMANVVEEPMSDIVSTPARGATANLPAPPAPRKSRRVQFILLFVVLLAIAGGVLAYMHFQDRVSTD